MKYPHIKSRRSTRVLPLGYRAYAVKGWVRNDCIYQDVLAARSGRQAKLRAWYTLRRHRFALRELEFTVLPMSVGELREAFGRAAASIVH